MTVIGIIGGIASGKSAVAEAFRQLGAAVIHADQIGHLVLDDPQVVQLLSERWGPRILGTNGKVNRSTVAEMVFGSTAAKMREREFLESVTHPRIEQKVRERIAELRLQGSRVIVLDAPILIEAGWQRNCDRIVFVEVDRAQRLQRACQRGWTEAQFAAREASQLSLEEKKKVADEVIDNSVSFDHTFAQIQHFWHSLIPLPPG